ncbi:hypothetical protein Q9L58_007162 [Maublancomyces gigas]|uniref:Uncharacterized protein n=1 Tax=Discina gigas TaxID=1032678 RepID=A0ABR3GD60_9PEZI
MLESPPLQKDEAQTPSSGKPQDGPEPVKKTFPRDAIVLDENGKPQMPFMHQLPKLGQAKRTYGFADRQIWDFTVVVVDRRNISATAGRLSTRRRSPRPLNMDLTSHHRRYVSFECDSGTARRDEDLPFGVLTDLSVLGLRGGFSGVG